MTPSVEKQLSDSAFDFQRLVWPVIQSWLGGGELRTVEAVTDAGFNRDLDVLAGIDAWHILRNEHAIRGIASRVQPIDADKGKRWDSFTIRYSLPSGNPTEYQKRLHAMNNADRGFLFPHVTTQAYVSQPPREGELLSVALLKTATLFELAEKLVDTGLDGQVGRWGIRPVKTGEQLLWISWNMFPRGDIKIWSKPKADKRQLDLLSA